MPSIDTALKAEVSRIARKELKAQTEHLKKASSQYRSEIAALKRRLADLERQLKRQSKVTAKAETKAEEEPQAKSIRFSAAGLAKQRQKLGLSAREVAQLLGVSVLSVYKWEQGKARPRAKQLEAIASLRGMGKREVRQRLKVAG